MRNPVACVAGATGAHAERSVGSRSDGPAGTAHRHSRTRPSDDQSRGRFVKVSAPRNTGEGPEQQAEHQRPREDQGPARASNIPTVARSSIPHSTPTPMGKSSGHPGPVSYGFREGCEAERYIGKLGMREPLLDMREPRPSRISSLEKLAISERNQPQGERTNFHYQRPIRRSV